MDGVPPLQQRRLGDTTPLAPAHLGVAEEGAAGRVGDAAAGQPGPRRVVQRGGDEEPLQPAALHLHPRRPGGPDPGRPEAAVRQSRPPRLHAAHVPQAHARRALRPGLRPDPAYSTIVQRGPCAAGEAHADAGDAAQAAGGEGEGGRVQLQLPRRAPQGRHRCLTRPG